MTTPPLRAGVVLPRSNQGMSRVEEIEQAIQKLSPKEFALVAQHVHALEQERWDHQLDQDAAARSPAQARQEYFQAVAA
jgi:hypothetical protein